MAVGVRFYGRGTRRPGEDIYEPGGGYQGPTKTTSPYLDPAERNRLEQARIAGLQSGAVQVPQPTATQVSALDPAAIAASLAEGITFQIPSIFPQPAPASSSGSSTLAATLAELDYKREQDKAEQDRLTRGSAASSQIIQDLLANLPARFTGLSNIIGETGRQNEEFIKQQYAEALRDLTSRRDTGAALQRTGFETAARQLGAMQPTAFEAPAIAAPTAATNQLQQYLSARGVPQEAINAEITKVNQASQDAQTNYTGLLGTLSAIERNAQQSRVVENSLAQAVANAQLQTIYGGATSALEQQRLKSLNDLFNQLQAQRFQLEQSKIAREDALNDSLAKIAQAGYGVRGPSEPTPGGGGGGGSDQTVVSQASTPAEALAALNALAPTNPNAPAQQMLQNIPAPQVIEQLIALAQQAPQYTGGGAGMGVAPGNEVVMMKDGGVVTKPTLAVIGEDGPEAVVPLTKPGKAKKVTKQAQREMVKQKFMRKYGMA